MRCSLWLMLRGPSPRIRGEFDALQSVADVEGTIPANTGRITVLMQSVPVQRDHPREYGENPCKLWVSVPLPGPSPRIRGEYIHRLRPAQLPGTIPANTGRIYGVGSRIARTWDHPREYGENDGSLSKAAVDLGPSPRIRGEFAGTVDNRDLWGTIPANTGRISDLFAPLSP